MTNMTENPSDRAHHAAPETYNETIIRRGALAFLVLLLALCAAAFVEIGVEIVHR